MVTETSPNPTGDEEETVQVNRDNQPGQLTPAYHPENLFIPNLFVNSAEEGEIENSMEVDNEGNENLEIKIEEQNKTNFTERRSERKRRRPNYYGAIKYC